MTLLVCPDDGETVSKIRLGVTSSMRLIFEISLRARSSAVNAVIDIGVYCRFSSRFRAVTMISSRPACSSCAAARGAVSPPMATAAQVAPTTDKR